jgi:hypothetical protein
MTQTWVKTKILVYMLPQEDEEQRKEREQQARLGLPVKETTKKDMEEMWVRHAFCLESIDDFYESPSDTDKTLIRFINGKEYIISADFDNLFLAVVGRVDEVEESEDLELYYVDVETED